MKNLYVKAMRLARSAARATGVLASLERSRNPNIRWIRSQFAIYDSADLASLDLPWWTYGAIEAVEARLAALQGRAKAFEYGAGASTIWLAKRCAQVASVEHDTGFAASMQDLFSRHSNIDLAVVPDVSATGGPGEARSRRKGYEDRSFDAYVAAIAAHPGEFDLIVIDGRARNACLAAAKGRLAPGGVILFDNSDRPEYRDSIEGCGLAERKLGGRAPALPMSSQTSLLARSN
jgi:hypothetical protein